MKKNISQSTQTEILQTPLNNIIYDVVTILPELFFTSKGYKYISDEYKIYNEELRRKCYEYVTDKISDYRQGSHEECFLDEPDSLYYAVVLIGIILSFIKTKQYDKLEKLISLDECIKWNIQLFSEDSYKTLIEILYDTRNISEFDFHNLVFVSRDNDLYLDFFLENSILTSTFTTEQIGMIILYYFDSQDKKSITKILNNLNNLKRILESSNKSTQKGKQLRKLKKQTIK